jgi:pSer/pThr/pTyr-binding forkhead associated (FHA) protein
VHGDAEIYLESALPASDAARYALCKDVVTVGRADDNDVVLKDPRVSRKHAELVRGELRYRVRDLGSRNGTFVNGTRVLESCEVTTGDQLSFGGVHLRFHDGASTVTTNPVRLLRLDDRTAEVHVLGQLISPTPKEYLLLRLLFANVGAVCGRDEIARTVWPEYEGQVADYNIDNLVARLRPKVERPAQGAVRIVAVKTRGYRLVLGATDS